jgi:ABC-type multidrug transport system ATPase subunit
LSAGGITGEVTHGSGLAIMGPSGAGKTTLLNMLTLEKKGGVPRGKIELNGQPFTRALYNKNCAYVQQEDSLWASFSSRDHLRYAFDLCQPHLSASEKKAAIDKLIDAVGLTEAQHTKAGNAFVRGLSSGLQRRLSIAIALAKNPHVLFLDEPTSGIDSASAASMMTFLKEIATTEKLAIACTIHQPSASVFAGFDKTLILSDGRVAFSGLASDLGPYLASLGRPLPLAANPAEFVLDLVNKDFTDKAAVYRILDKYDEAREKAPPPAIYTLAPLQQVKPPAGPMAQALILTRRQLQ